MINIIEKKHLADGESYYFNIETEERYGEIVGGLAWQDIEDGFLVIAAVDLCKNTESETRRIRVLAEASESDIHVLLRHALELQKQFSPFMERIKFYGDTTSLPMMELLYDFNWGRRYQNLDPFYLTEAPQSKNPQKLEFYVQLIKTYTRSGRKILHFCDTVLPRYLMDHSPDQIRTNVLDHPPIAALGYALAVLSTWRPRKGEFAGKRRDQNKGQIHSDIRL